MHTLFSKESTLKIKYGHLVVETVAVWKNKRKKVQEINLDKGIRYNGVYYSGLCGYGVVFDGESIYTRGYGCYYGNVETDKQKWTSYRITDFNPVIIDSRIVTEEELQMIYSLYPDFRYTIQKSKKEFNVTFILTLLKKWLEHPQEVEMLYSLGYPHLLECKSIYTMTKEKKVQFIKFLQKASQIVKKELNFKEIQILLKINKLDFEYISYMNGFSYDVWTKRVQMLDRPQKDYWRWHYKDYLKLAKELGHNTKDDYWKYPKDLKQAHDSLLETKERILAAKREEEFKPLEKRIKKYLKYNAVVDGYEIFFSADPEAWNVQAKALSQCIVANSYYKKTTCILAFIRKDNEPIATAEILANKKIGQFYADERNRNDCKPSDEVKNVFYKWLENVKVGARL